MKKRQIYVALFILALLGLLSSAVYAQSMLDPVLKPFERVNIGQIYARYWYIIDCVMYFIILVGVSQFALSKQFEGRGGKAVIIGVGVSLAIAASYFEYKTKFMLIATLGPLAVIAVIILFLVAIYKFATALGGEGSTFGMLAFAFLFFYVSAMMPQVAAWFNRYEWTKLIWALLNILAIVFLIWGMIRLISSIASGGKEGRESWLDRLRGKEPGERERKEKGPGRVPEPSGEEIPPEEALDYKNPGRVLALVTDLNNKPLQGVEVILTGAKSGKPWQLPFWRRRGPFWRAETGPEGTVEIDVPSGNLRVEASAKGWRFYDVSCENMKTTYILVKPGDATRIVIRMRKIEVEPNPKILGIDVRRGELPEENRYYIKGRID